MFKRILYLLVVYLLPCLAFCGENLTEKGYAASAILAAGQAQGTVLAKDRLFTLAWQEGVFTLTALDEQGQEAVTLSATANARGDKTSLVVQFERILEQAQGRDGYRLVLFLNGKRVVEKECTPYTPCKEAGELSAGEGFAQSLSDLQEYPRSLTPEAIRKLSGISVKTTWAPDASAETLLETPEMTFAFAKGRGQGNPFRGAFNKMTQALMLASGGLNWELHYRDAQGISHCLDADDCDFQPVELTEAENGQGFTLRWTSKLFTELQVRGTVSGPRLEAVLELRGFASDARLETVAFPCWRFVKMPGNDVLLYPSFSGIEKPNPTNGFYHSATWPNGHASMQFAALYNDQDCGVYIGNEDTSGCINRQVYEASAGLLDATWQHPIARGTRDWLLPGKAVLETYRGRWYEAGQIYKRFVRKAPWWVEEIPRRDTPQWFLENPFWIGGIPLNEESVETYRYVQEFLEVPAAFVCGLLENPNGPWRFGPNFRVKQHVVEPMKRLHESKDIKLEPYFNCRQWYAGPDADKENNYTTEGKPNAVLDENGNVRTGNYGATGLHAVMCPAAPAWRQRLYGNIEYLASQGVDAVYHDQLPCSTPFACEAENHGHAPGAADCWLAQGHWLTYGRVMGELRAKYPNLAHTGEDASDAFLRCLDGFMTWRFGRTGHVPLFQSVYAPRVQFVGRGGDGNNISGTYESFFPRIGEQLVYGEQIGWLALDDIRVPSPRRNYLKKLANLRYALAGYLNAAEMAKPLKFAKPLPTMTTVWGVDDTNNCTTDRILHSVWQHKDGSRLVIFLNTTETAEEAEPILDGQGQLVTVFREGEEAFLVQADIPPALRLEPYVCEIWLLGTAPSDGFSPALMAAVRKGREIMNGGDRGLMIPSKTDFTKDMMLNAIRDELFARDASWVLFANRTDNPTLDYHPNPLRKMNANWIAAQDGGIIYFGGVYFGDSATELTCTAATDCEGVTIEMLDNTANSPTFLLAEFKLERGGWHEYKSYTTPLLRHITGRRNIFFRVKGGSCNFKSWRAK